MHQGRFAMNAKLNLEAIEHEWLDERTKGFPYGTAPVRVADVGAKGWNLLGGALPFPQAVIKDTALAHNHGWMRDFTSATGVLLAPHGKTTMAPQIFAQQLAAGAWGITVATVQQVALCVRFGIRRVIMANQLVGASAIAEVIRLCQQHQDLEFYFLVDSLTQLQLIEAEAGRHTLSRRLAALLELGIPGGRTGTRSEEEALALAAAIAASATVELAGIECYEGLQITGDSTRDAAFVAGLMQSMHRVALACDRARQFAGPAIILSAGGSAAFDIVARELPTHLSKPVQTILRSGCYVTHDSGFYARMLENVKARSGAAWQDRPGLRPALEVWAQVQSRPEPGLALLTMGKRDASFDLDLPKVQSHFRGGRDTVPQAAPADWKISAMNDQHAYLRVPADADVRVGDLIGSGISHPCTTFDKWRALFTVDDAYRVTGAILTYF
jgi:D-serine dehydratase